MKRFVLIVIALMLTLTAAACRTDSDDDRIVSLPKTETPGDASGKPIGFSSEEELINEFIDCYNKGKISERFLNAFDSNAFIAYWMIDESFAPDMRTAYDVYRDRSKGAEFINRQYPSFAANWAKYYGEDMTDEAFQTYFIPFQYNYLGWYCSPIMAQMRYEYVQELEKTDLDIEEYVVQAYLKRYGEFKDYEFPKREDVDKVFAEWKARFGGTDARYRAEDTWISDYGYSAYDVRVNDPQNLIISIAVRFIYRDGSYYWFLLHQTA